MDQATSLFDNRHLAVDVWTYHSSLPETTKDLTISEFNIHFCEASNLTTRKQEKSPPFSKDTER